MKIVFISTMFGGNWGGSEELWAAAAREALSRGWEVEACVFRYRPRAEKLDRLITSGIKVHERKGWPRAVSRRLDGLFSPFPTWSRGSKPDVIFISQGFPYDFCERYQIKELERLTQNYTIPYVVICQYNSDEIVPSARSFDFARQLYGRARLAAFVSDHNRRVTERQLAMALPNAVTVRNPVNLNETSLVNWPAPASTLRMASVARLNSGTKGLDILLVVLARQAWKERDWKLNFYGSGPDLGYLQKLTTFLGLEARVTFCGQVSDIRAVWAQNEVLVLPSRGEGTPLALVEAMLCGRPAVVTDVGGNAEWICDEESGFVAAAANCRCFAPAMERMWQRRDDLASMGRVARFTAERLHDPMPGRTLLNLACPSKEQLIES